MNAIVALCHFCEQHGPRVLFCTQPFHEQEPLQMLISTAISDTESIASASTSVTTPSLPRRTLRSVSMDSVSSQTDSVTSVSRDRCEGCRSLQSHEPGFMSNDYEAKVRYVSSQQPHHDEVYSIVRQACIRSLSSEVCPGREGPIFFGDSNSRYVLSYAFHLQDTKSRGGQRLYSIMVVMMDKVYLLNSMPFLIKHLKRAIQDMQRKASTVYKKEEAANPTRPACLSERRSYTMPTQIRLQRNLGSAVRSLNSMTDDDDLFRSLHLSFTWVLKACSNRLTEKLLEGPPTEDSIIDLEKKEEVDDDDFVLVNTEKVKEPLHGKASVASTGTLSPENDMDSVEVVEQLTFENLRQLFELMGYHSFHQLAHHVIIGNQVIVQTDSLGLTMSLIDCLQVLLPKGCCKVIYHSDHYLDAYKCNFLGLSKFCELPDHVINSDHYVLVNVESPRPTHRPMELSLNRLLGFRIQLHIRPGQAPLDRASAPKILEKMERAIANMNLSWNVVEQSLICIKEEWMNKVKVLFTFTKAGGNRSDDDTKKLLQVFGASEEDKRALKFWMTGLSHQYKNHMRHISKCL